MPMVSKYIGQLGAADIGQYILSFRYYTDYTNNLSKRKECYITFLELMDSAVLHDFKRKGYHWLVLDTKYQFFSWNRPIHEDIHYKIHRFSLD